MELLVLPTFPGENNRAYAQRVLRANIMTLRLKPGEALNEVALSDALHMSRTPIHEAISALRGEFLVEIFPQKGTQVSRIDPGLVKEGYAARLLLESALLRDEAGKVSQSDIQLLLDNLTRQEATLAEFRDHFADGIDEFIHLDDDFHRMMYFYGGRSHTWTALRGLVSHYDRMRYLDALDGEMHPERIVVQHREFCEYLMLGLPAGISPEQKVAEHLTSFRGNLLGKIEANPEYFTLEKR